MIKYVKSKYDYKCPCCSGRVRTRLNYKGKEIKIIYHVTNKCVLCGNEGPTDLHHVSYQDNDPLKYTIELCRECHKHLPKRKLKDKFKDDLKRMGLEK